MIPVRPVIFNFETAESEENDKTVMVAKDQPEYQTLPSIFLDEGNFNLSRWIFDNPDEFERFIETEELYLYQSISRIKKFITGFIISPEFRRLRIDDVKSQNLEYLVSKMFNGEFHPFQSEFSEHQENLHRCRLSFSNDEIEMIKKNQSIYIYQINLQRQIVPFLPAVERNIVFK